MLFKDWVLFSSIVSFLDRNGLLGHWRSGIDFNPAQLPREPSSGFLGLRASRATQRASIFLTTLVS